MKNILLLFVALFMCFSLSALEISVESGSFRNGDKTYLETYLRVLGQTVKFNSLGGGSSSRQASVDFTITISKDGKIASYEKFKLSSPESKSELDFLDVKRFAVNPGAYLLKIEAIDSNDPTNTLELEKYVTVGEFSMDVDLSDVLLSGKVTQSDESNPMAKNGLYMEPLTYGIVTEDIEVLNIYTEAYLTTNSDDILFLKYSMSKGYANEEGEEIMKKVKKLSDGAYQPLILQLPVDKIISGNYHVELQIINKSKAVLVSRKVNFIKENLAFDHEYWTSYNEEEDNSFLNNMTLGEVDYGLRATSPVVFEPKKSMLDYIIKDAPIRAKKKFLFSIWRDKHPKNTENHYHQYLTIAKAVDLEYNNNVGYGFETDRGYIFLRYGKPNSVLTIDQEPEAYPYEIWYYHQVKETTQTNVRFIFYNKSLVAKDYKLLHSTCRGETINPAWEIELYSRSLEVQEERTIDSVQSGDGWNRRARQYFNEY